jgi:hypothetical protein
MRLGLTDARRRLSQGVDDRIGFQHPVRDITIGCGSAYWGQQYCCDERVESGAGAEARMVCEGRDWGGECVVWGGEVLGDQGSSSRQYVDGLVNGDGGCWYSSEGFGGPVEGDLRGGGK